MSAEPLTKREREYMEVLYRIGEGTVAEVQAELTGAPSYSAVRGILRILHEKGHVTARADGVRYVFSPAHPKDAAARTALSSLVTNFFGGSVEQVVSTLLNEKERDLTNDDLDRLSDLIERAKRGEHV